MGFIKSYFTILLLCVLQVSWAQVNRYMVFFKDKAETSYSIDSPETYLSSMAIARRNNQNISITEQDFPVNKPYVQGVRNAGAEVLFTTRWMNGALVQCNASAIPTIEALTFVDRVELVAPSTKPNGNGRKKITLRTKEGGAGTATYNQLTMLGIHEMHNEGYRGEGITIAIFDSGFQGVDVAPPFQHMFTSDRINLNVSHDFVHDKEDVFQYDDHGTEVFSVIAAYQPDFYTGGAHKANFQLYITEDVGSEYRVEEYNWLFAAERADSAGVDIINSSLGYNTFSQPSMNYTQANMDGKTAVITRAATYAADRGILVIVSAGNEGNNSWQIVTAPADAENVLSIGAISSAGQRISSSSKGPTADGRIKPDVVAMGLGTSVIRSNGSLGSSTGTSLAAPLITGLAAGVLQRYPALTNKEIMEAIRSSASQANAPDNLVGYGIPNFKAIVNKLDWSPQLRTFEIYPTRIIDTINIRPRDPQEISSCHLAVISMQGQEVASQIVNFDWLNRTYSIDCSALSPGVYIVQLRTGNETYTYKVVKI